MRHKPSFILFDQQLEKDEGFLPLKNYLVDQKGFDIDVLRTLLVRYPATLSKKIEEYDQFFSVLEQNGINDE